jgi:hypothetical protein
MTLAEYSHTQSAYVKRAQYLCQLPIPYQYVSLKQGYPFCGTGYLSMAMNEIFGTGMWKHEIIAGPTMLAEESDSASFCVSVRVALTHPGA